jgi:hydrogenase-4 component F
MIWALLLVPTLAAAAAFLIPADGLRRGLLVLAAAAHSALTGWLWVEWLADGTAEHSLQEAQGWLGVDGMSILFLSIMSGLFLVASIYAVGYLHGDRHHPPSDDERSAPFTRRPEATFTACLLLFQATMTLVALSRHLGLMWVAVEATTLASAPLIYYHRNRRSLEATWKYLVICSVGIALALLGNFFLAAAARATESGEISMIFTELSAKAAALDPRWLKAAFVLFLVGYGTKMGLAPLHTWLPDAHSEAPSPVSALLSGTLLNCAFLAVLRCHGVLVAAGLGEFSRDLLIVFGLLSMGVAAAFIIGQSDFKRMLAYSSIEHMGILCLGIGVGGIGTFGSMLHAVNHSLTKAMLFLVAGNLLLFYRTKSTETVRGVLHSLPWTGILWMAGFLAICGSPPFGPFLSELTILKGAIAEGHVWVAAGYLAALVAVFIGMATIVMRMAYGSPAEVAVPAVPPQREPLWSVVPPAVLVIAVLVLGFYVPPPLAELLHKAAAVAGGNG